MGFGRELKDFAEGFQHGVETAAEADKAKADREKTRAIKESDIAGQPDEPTGGATVPRTDGDQTSSTSSVDFKDDPQAGQVLGFIRDHEAGTKDPYNTLVGGKTANLTGMTVGDVLNYQQSMLKNGHESTALGAYQIINKTLKNAVAELKLDPSTPFNEATQDQLGYHLLQKRGWNDYKSGKIDKDTFMDNVANEWAILPLASGRSAYEGVGSNKAGMSRDTFAAVVPDDFSAPTTTASTSGAVPEPDDGQKATQQQAGFFGGDTDKVDPKLRRVTERAARDNPNLFALNPKTKTLRSEAEQRDMVNKGWSKTMNSKHRVGKAADLVPINPKTGQADPDYTSGYDAITRAMRKAAQDEGVSDLKWGGDWKSFKDRPHWEVSQLEQQQLDAGGLSPPREQEVQPTMFGERGGVIPEPVQSFADGGAPVINPNNPSAVNGVDKYTPTRAYTQPLPASTGTGMARRINFDYARPAATAAGQPTSSQLAFRKMQADAAARPAYQAPAPAPVAAPAAKPAAVKSRSVPMSVVMPYGNQGGAFGFYDPTLGSRIGQKQQRFADGGVIPEPEQSFARGGSVRDTRFKELERQESRQRSQHTDDGGESPRDRAARRLSAEEGRASSTAYRPSQDKEYFRPAGEQPKKGGDKKGGPDKTETSSTDTHVRHPPNPTVGVPEPEEDRATRFRESELVPGPSSVREAREPEIAEDRATRFRESELIPDDRASRTTEATMVPGPSSVREPKPVPAPAAPRTEVQPTVPYTPPGGGVNRRVEPLYTHKEREARRIQDAAKGERRRQELHEKFPNAAISTSQNPQGAVGTEPDPERFAPGVPTPSAPAANKMVPVLLDTETGQIHDPNAAPVRTMPGHPEVVAPARLGYAEGGVIPEPGQEGYNEAVASGATATQEPQAEPERAKVRATPELVSDVRKALDGGVRFLQKTFGLGGEGAVATPDDAANADSGAQRFAAGEGAADQQEVSAIDDHVDPTRELDEGHRQMTRLAKTMRWYQGRGRKDEAEAAAGSLMQYGASRFSKLGTMSQASYSQYLKTGDPQHLDATVKFLEKAYEMIPDGAQVNVRINNQTGKLEAEHTDEEGDTTFMEVDPQELPGLIKSVQDKSMYWNSIFRMADPEGAKSKDVTERSIASEKRGDIRTQKTEQRADTREQEKNTRENLETIETEKRTDVRKVAEEKRAEATKKTDEARAEQRAINKTLLDAAIAEDKAKGKPPTSGKDMTVLSPLLSDAAAAKKAYEADQSGPNKDAMDLAISKVAKAANGDFAWLTAQGFDLGDFQYRDPGQAEAAAAESAANQPGAKPPEGAPPGTVRKKHPKTGQPIWAFPDKNAPSGWSQLGS